MTDPREALQVLLDLTQKLLERRPLESALREVTDAALRLLPGDHASVRVLDHTHTELLSGARSGRGADHSPVSFRPGEGVVGWVIEHGEVARIQDTSRDERFVQRAAQGFDIAAILAVPLWSAGEVVGVLAVTSSQAGTYGEDDERLACLLANCAVPPIERARLARLAITDPNTMAFNQGFLMPGLRFQMDRAREAPAEDAASAIGAKPGGPARGPLAVMLLDLDHFKRINDAQGHAAGDQVLREFTERIRRSTRGGDLLVRRGGDEFVLIMPGTTRYQAKSVAERIRRSMESEPIDLGEGRKASVTVSIGVAAWDGGESPEALEKRADAAMYQAKLHGRNRTYVDPS